MAEEPFSRNLRTFSHDLRSVCNRNLYEWFDDKPIPRITNTEMPVPRITNTELPVLRIIKLTLEQNIDSSEPIRMRELTRMRICDYMIEHEMDQENKFKKHREMLEYCFIIMNTHISKDKITTEFEKIRYPSRIQDLRSLEEKIEDHQKMLQVCRCLIRDLHISAVDCKKACMVLEENLAKLEAQKKNEQVSVFSEILPPELLLHIKMFL